MNKQSILGMITFVFIIGVIIGILVSSVAITNLIKKYPTVDCIINLDSAINVDNNKLPFTKQSQRESIQWRCAKQTIDSNITDYDDVLKMGE